MRDVCHCAAPIAALDISISANWLGLAMAVAAYWAAIQSRPKDKITLRQGARVVMKSWSE